MFEAVICQSNASSIAQENTRVNGCLKQDLLIAKIL